MESVFLTAMAMMGTPCECQRCNALWLSWRPAILFSHNLPRLAGWRYLQAIAG
ncbi:hypothetical protein LED50_26635 [Salmonella enterica]|nr:hypothetical protein [Salmonella enterica]